MLLLNRMSHLIRHMSYQKPNIEIKQIECCLNGCNNCVIYNESTSMNNKTSIDVNTKTPLIINNNEFK